ncbi:hypothetical protein VB711_08115 [Cronbergia sp. UHCC 0137]|uniref:hypothetical protein n=1 Tax=Cronbergia sp. UHCC 0137 TaxID=3110239 RepID=UPI002B20311A|nr:hypothetical protein [Cronbergia sp. UHCC 0137]MEA5617801.1 hypothetical protein [Cronbergia sp. UHCC 0137]
MFSLDKPEELIKMKLVSSIKKDQFDSQKEIDKLFFLSYPDIIVLDKNQQIALLVDVQARKTEIKEESLSPLTKLYLQNTDERDIRFAMLANFKKINIFKSNTGGFLEPIVSLSSSDILSHYDPEFNDRTILYLYFRTLIEAWLRDLAYHWKSETPPGSKELLKIGLLEKIEDGDTYSQNE